MSGRLYRRRRTAYSNKHMEIRENRMKAIYAEDEHMVLRKSH